MQTNRNTSNLSEISIWKILDSNYDVVAGICDTLFKKTMIRHFDYIRFYDSGEMMCLGTTPEFILSSHKNKLVPTEEELKLIYMARLKVFYLSNDMPLPPGAGSANPEKYNEIISMQSDFNIYHRICIVDRGPNYYRACAFGVNCSSKSVFTYYINLLDTLRKFIKYFESKVNELNDNIDKQNTIRIPYFHQKIVSLNEKNGLIQFESELDFENNNLSKFTDKLFTLRERECVSLIAQGYTMKSAAIQLQISPRTVEQHLRNIKDRYGLHTKNQLVDFWHAREVGVKSEY